MYPEFYTLSTTDFFYPLVEDPYIQVLAPLHVSLISSLISPSSLLYLFWFYNTKNKRNTHFFLFCFHDGVQGKIACANVLSDMYALGISRCDNMLMLLGYLLSCFTFSNILLLLLLYSLKKECLLFFWVKRNNITRLLRSLSIYRIYFNPSFYASSSSSSLLISSRLICEIYFTEEVRRCQWSSARLWWKKWSVVSLNWRRKQVWWYNEALFLWFPFFRRHNVIRSC